jgi:type III restriction enzyme
MYTPDFLIISRKGKNIYKAIIVETKGEIYANDPIFKDKKEFMETAFKTKNNTEYGYKRFDYLYLPDTLSDLGRIIETAKAIDGFFKEDK